MSTDHTATLEQPVAVGERDSLAMPIELEEGAPPALARAALAIISGLIVLLLVWSNIAQVRERSIAFGEISPYGSTREVAHLEGGIVEDVYVEPGEEVAEGDELVRLRVENAGGEFSRFAARRGNLTLVAERLSAQLEDRRPDFGDLQQEWPELAEEQRSIYAAAVNQHKSAMETLTAKEASARSEVAGAEAEAATNTELRALARQQLSIQEELIEEGFTSRQAYIDAQAAFASASAAARASQTRLEQARGALASASAELESADAAYRNRVAEERARALAELAEIEKPLLSLEDQAERLTVRAPIGGLVKSIDVKGRGDVVRPGGLIAEITPIGARLVAEVRIQPKDIGHVAIDQETDITVTTFDPNRYGTLTGRISHISADTFVDERTGEPYYVGYVSLESEDPEQNALMERLAPGMEVRADIITRSRSLMQYLLKPVERSLDRAFAER